MFKIATEVYENVSKACRKTVRTFQYGFRHEALRTYAKAQQKRLKKVTPRSGKTTKHAADDWEIEYKYNGIAVTGFNITNPHDRIDYLEYGTDPHMIFPKRAKVLRFEMDGKIVFAHSVEHPGIKPMGFVRKVQDELDQEAPAFIKRYFDAPIEKHWV